jgi:hypothetical protein
MKDPSVSVAALRVLAITQGTWGERIASHIHSHAPEPWHVEMWAAPRVLPPVVDYPEDFLPSAFEPADLIVALGETAGLAQLIPDVVRLSQAKAVIAPVDFNEALPTGLIRQLTRWVKQEGAEVIFPRPFCSLTPTTYNRTPLVRTYDNPLIRAFAERFGRPTFDIQVADGRIASVQVECEAACGCSQHVAEGLIGLPVDEAVEAAGMLHHHYPCLASMNQDLDYHDTLMHVSGDYLRDALKDEIRPFLSPTPYLRPSGRMDTSSQPQGE